MTHQINNPKVTAIELRRGHAVRRPVFRLPWTALLALTLMLSSCSTTNTQSAETKMGGNICESHAALINPAAKDSAIDGLGGTGIRLANNGRNGNGGGEGGIGGTGVVAGVKQPVFGDGGMGGTGIVGVITGFASICVNGIEVNYDSSTPVWDNGKPSALSQLVVGQVVSVAATGNGNQFTARGIGVIQAVVGPITAVNATTGELQVMGQRIQVSRSDLTTLKVGNWLRVSGHSLANGEVVASHLQVIPLQENAQAQVRSIAHDFAGKSIKVGDTPVDLSSVQASAKLANGQEIWVSGVWNGQSLQARELVVNPTLQGLGRVEKIVLEGYIHSSNKLSINLGSQALTLSDSTQIVGGSRNDLMTNRRVQVSGRVGSDQSISVERVEFSRSSRNGGSGKSSSSNEDPRTKPDDTKSAASGSDGSGSGSSGSGSSGSGSSGSGSSGSGSSGSGSSGSGSSGSGSSGSGSSGSGSSGSGSSGSGSSGSGSSGSGSSGSGKGSSSSSGSSSSGSGKGGSK
jgi:Domain of unknown function (DUF5666)